MFLGDAPKRRCKCCGYSGIWLQTRRSRVWWWWYGATPSGPTCLGSGVMHLVNTTAVCRGDMMDRCQLSRLTGEVSCALTVAGCEGLDG